MIRLLGAKAKRDRKLEGRRFKSQVSHEKMMGSQHPNCISYHCALEQGTLWNEDKVFFPFSVMFSQDLCDLSRCNP